MRVVVTGGGTIAPIDDVRQITNASTGRFSALITEACLRRGAEVWHIHAHSALLPFRRSAQFDLATVDPTGEVDRLLRLRAKWRSVRDRLHLVPLASGTVADYRSTLKNVLLRESIDVAFLAMAVTDFEPDTREGKIDSGVGPIALLCQPTPKVIREVRDWAPDIYLVGFKLLSGVSEEELAAAALAANQANRADLTVANDWSTVQRGRHTIHLVRPGFPVESYSGEDAAERLVERVFEWAALGRLEEGSHGNSS
jgi:phosphopantothenate-cysteine ligase